MVDHIGEGTKFGRYALLEKIGTGGMAEIFRAKTFGAAGFEKEFAIKLILPSLVDDSEFVEMFINEAKIAVSLYHANIVQVFDLGEIDGQYYIAMEYVLGKDLLDILARCAEQDLKIPLNLVLFITMEMLKGLNFAHRAKDPFGEDLNIIHRDVSPSNIMISYAGDVKVGDFGVAKAAIERTLTESGTLKGKVGYMSPEQVMGDEIDARSDIFAAGVVFFEALSMSRLFVGGSDLEVMLKVRDADVEESLAEAEPLPSGLRTIVEKALTKHPEERFQTSGEFYQALVDFCYQHSIKVTGTDLANFMRRLFAEEIEEEKSKRREEPRLDELMPDAQFDEFSTQSSDQKAASEAEGARASASKQEQQGDPASAPNEGSLAQASTKRSEIDGSGIRSGRAARYRYRDSSGLIYGPMRLEALVELIEQQDLLEGDRVSVDDGPWQPPHEIEQLAAHLPDEIEGAGIEDTEVADVARSAHVSNPSEASASSAVVDEQSDKTDEAVGDQSTTVPEESALSRELEEAVTSLEQLSESVAQQQSEASSPEIPSFGGPSSAFSEGRDDEIRTGTARLVDDSEATQQAIEELKNEYATSYEGALAEVPFARLLARLHRYDATGRLHVERDVFEKSIFLRDGEPILVESTKEGELLGEFLMEKGRITEEQLDEALDRLSEWGGRLGDALVAIGVLEANEVFEVLAEQMRQKLLDVFTWPDGHYGYYENQEPDTLAYPLGIDTYSTIVQACRSEIPLEMIRDFYTGRMHTPIYQPDEPPIDVDRLKLSARELRVMTQLQSGSHLQAVIDAVDDEERREVAWRTVYLLHQVEVFQFETTDTHSLPGD